MALTRCRPSIRRRGPASSARWSLGVRSSTSLSTSWGRMLGSTARSRKSGKKSPIMCVAVMLMLT
eukprot:6208551-Prymnesium_polylepis.1